jgi:ATP-dependent DNA helicase RecG
VAKLIARAAGGERVIDLLFHMPESYLDRTARPTIRSARAGTVATLAVEVVRHERPAHSRQPWRIVVRDDTGTAELVFFRFTREAQMPPGAELVVSGKIDLFNGRVTIAHPEHLVSAAEASRIPMIEPVWPLTAGLWPRQVAAGIAQGLERLPELPEWHDAALMRREKWPSFREALRAVQMPESAAPHKRIRARLAYDEFLAGQVALALVRGRVRARVGRALTGGTELRAKALERFGFAPTESQVKALAEIDADLC